MRRSSIITKVILAVVRIEKRIDLRDASLIHHRFPWPLFPLRISKVLPFGMTRRALSACSTSMW